MSTESNRAVAGREVEAMNRKDLSNLEELVAADVVYHDLPPGLPAGIDGYRALLSMFLTAFPDLTLTIEDQVAEGDRVATRLTGRGTHGGDFLGIPATGKPIQAQAITIMRFAGGKIAEEWEQIDLMAIMQQIGAIPAAVGAAP